MGTAKQYFSSNQGRVGLTLLGITGLGVAIDWASKRISSSLMDETNPGFIFHEHAFSIYLFLALLVVVAFSAVVISVARNRLELWSVGAFIVWAGYIGNSMSSLLSGGAPDFIALKVQRMGGVPIIVHNNPDNLTLINVADCMQYVGSWMVLVGAIAVAYRVGRKKFGPNRKCLWTSLSAEDEIRGHGGMVDASEWKPAQ